ncbi:MAG: hypothetical protein M3459_12490 [Actinomycetota bacterium]|nr:hypothetical protein [Actinomycetota bacterium]
MQQDVGRDALHSGHRARPKSQSSTTGTTSSREEGIKLVASDGPPFTNRHVVLKAHDDQAVKALLAQRGLGHAVATWIGVAQALHLDALLIRTDDVELGIISTDAGLFTGWLDVVWQGPASPEWLMRDVTHLPPSRAVEDLVPAINRTRRQRTAALRGCRLCGQRFVPGHMHITDICQGCAEQQLEVTH